MKTDRTLFRQNLHPCSHLSLKKYLIFLNPFKFSREREKNDRNWSVLFMHGKKVNIGSVTNILLYKFFNPLFFNLIDAQSMRKGCLEGFYDPYKGLFNWIFLSCASAANPQVVSFGVFPLKVLIWDFLFEVSFYFGQNSFLSNLYFS